MKTKDLIALLQEVDPTGETEVTVGNAPVVTAQRLPGYYDGTKWRVITKENGVIEALEYDAKTDKIEITPYNLHCLLLDHMNVVPKLEIRGLAVDHHVRQRIDNYCRRSKAGDELNLRLLNWLNSGEISSRACEIAEKALMWWEDSSLPIPSVFLTLQGGLQAEWVTDWAFARWAVDVEINKDGEIDVSVTKVERSPAT